MPFKSYVPLFLHAGGPMQVESAGMLNDDTSSSSWLANDEVHQILLKLTP